VLLGCRVRGEQLCISVWDSGVGIDEADKQVIFQEFHRLDYAQRLDERGLGLGLAICDRIARMLNHTIDLYSRPGRGSCFSVMVPLASPDEMAQRTLPADAPGEPAKLEELTVLVIDNEPEILEGMKMLLEHWGCRVMLAGDQLETARQVRELGAPGLVLVDYHLSGQANGLDVMEHLDLLLGTSLPAIVITADRSIELEDKVRQKNYGLLRKPIKPGALRALMTNTIKNR
jgi:CheY-like chemotaxis protein